MPNLLARIYTKEPEVLALAASLIPIAGVFQVFDGLQVVCVGILRGMGDTRAPMVVALFGFWLIGTPVSAFLGFATPLGAHGLWWGILAGLGAVAAFLLIRVRLLMQRDLARVVIDDHATAQ
jgi:MATE family multidrug resistance protein